jgi:NAD(P)-dependent dehydrogenase (short-subunit alcohol dehydrogenase family)
MKRFTDKVIIVVGATSGMGEFSAYRFADEGAKVLVVGRREKKGLGVVEKIEKNGGKASFLKADISKMEDCKNIINTAIERYKKIDVLANVAGYHISKGVENTTVEEWNYLMNTNLKSFFLLCKYAVPYLKETKGNIVNMSSMVGLIGQSNACAYAATKGGIIAMSKNMALDLAKYGIRVNIVCPGFIRSELTEDWFKQQGEKEQEIRDYVDKKHPLGRIGENEEAAAAIAFLASKDASFITGITLPVDGGITLGY